MPIIISAEAIFAEDIRQEIGKSSLMGIMEGALFLNPDIPLVLNKIIIQIGLLVDRNQEVDDNYKPHIEIISSNGEVKNIPLPWPPPLLNAAIPPSSGISRIAFNISLPNFAVSLSGDIVVKIIIEGHSSIIGDLPCRPFSLPKKSNKN